MQQSKFYVVFYAALLTIVCGALLAMASVGLKEKQDQNVANEKKEIILSVAMNLPEGANVDEIYSKRVKSYVVNIKGEVMEGENADDINILKMFKVKKEADKKYKGNASVTEEEKYKGMLLPVYEVLSEDGSSVIAYVLPLYGKGLWDDIWGYVALKEDLNSINGVNFDHKGETPGLGARIATEEIQSRYPGKQIFAGETLKGIEMVKGEQGGADKSIKAMESNPNAVDGMSGATITANGLNKMFETYLGLYKNFIESKRAKKA